MAMNMKKLLTKKNLIYLIVAVAIWGVLFGLSEGKVLSYQMRNLLVPIGINVILAVSLNLIVGFLGELALGHAGFMAVGAYAGCLLIKSMSGLPPILALILGMLVGGLAAAAVGLVIGLPVLRLRGDYVAIVTLAFNQIIVSLFVNLEVTGGASGLKGIPMEANFSIVFVMMVITVLVISALANSRHGRAITSIRESEVAARSIGINITYYKMMAFLIAAFFAGVAGVLYGSDLGILTPSTFDYNKSIEILVFVVLGGMGSLPGSIIAATILTLLPELLREFSDFRMLAYSIVLIVIMLLNASPKFNDIKAKLNWKTLWQLIRKKTAKKESAAE